MAPDKKYLTIGELVSRLKKIYPDISSSKLRFLESKGLLNPGRAENKYRIYSREDVKKITFILKMQKDYYMPLEVIKEKLSSINFDFQKEDNKAIKDIQLKLGEDFSGLEPKSLTVEEAAERYNVTPTYINELIEGNIIDSSEEGEQKVIGNEDIELIKLAVELKEYGIQAKHLKMFDNFSTRHASFMQQIVLPLILSSNKGSHKKGLKILNQIEANVENFHNLLVKKKNRKFLEKHK
ncbi:MAG: MerR family transcriptional regulator [Actinomycetota bacterium]